MSESERPRIVISEEDLPAAPTAIEPSAPTATEALASAAPEFPSVQGVRARPQHIEEFPAVGPSAAAPFLRTAQGRNIVAAIAGIAVGWGVAELTVWSLWTPLTVTALDLFAGTWVAIIGFCFAVIYVGWEHVQAQNWEGVKLVARRVGIWGATLGFGSGVLAQIVYRHITIQILQHATFSEYLNLSSNADLYLARALGWGLFGVGMGLATAAGTGSRDKAVNGLLGGAVGGAVGGLVFNWAGFNVSSGAFARLIGLLFVGAGIGIAIGAIEKARREAWLHVVGGGMAGKEFILYDADCKVGSSPKCEITLIKDPAIQPFHFVIQTPEGATARSRLLSACDGCAVTVNGQPVVRHQLRPGDTIGVGGTALSYSERATAA